MKLNYLIKAVSLALFTLLVSCDSKTKEKKIIFIPGEYRTIYFENFKSKEKKEINESAPNEMKIRDGGEITSLEWTAPITESKKEKKFKLSNYNFVVAGIQKLNYELGKNKLFISDSDCFSPLGVKRVEFSLNKSVKDKDVYFYKITSSLNDKASEISKKITKLSCLFTTNLSLTQLNPKLSRPNQSAKVLRTSLFVINRDSWFYPPDGGTKSDFYTHTVKNNWVKVYQDFNNIFENVSSVYFSLGNTYFIGRR